MGRCGIGALLGACLCAAGGAQAQGGVWRLELDPRAAVLSGTAVGGTAQLRLVCEVGAALAEAPLQLTFEGLAGWTQGAGAVLRIDGRAYDVQVDVDGPDFARMNHRPDSPGFGGIGEVLFGALDKGEILILDGPAAAAMPADLREFSLALGRGAFAGFRLHCGF